MKSSLLYLAVLGLPLCLIARTAGGEPARPFRIRVSDSQTGRGVPLVELTTVSQVRFVTDSQGLIALDEPDLRDEDVFFTVQSHGYEFPADGFGFHGKTLRVTPGELAELKIRRINIAERLYRVTGAGIYRDSLLAGEEMPLEKPSLNARVVGQDSVLTALYKGKLYWFWGDTNRPSYPLGNFHVPGARSLLPGEGGLPPDRGVNLEYFPGPDGFAKATAALPGDGPTWLQGLTVVHDPSGGERLFAGAMKVRNLLEVYRRSIVEWDDARQQWQEVADVPLDAPAYPAGHPVETPSGGVAWVSFAQPFLLTRVRHAANDFLNLSAYESFTCLKEGTTLGQGVIDRDATGAVRYGWKKNTPPVSSLEQSKLVERRLLRPEEGLIQLRDARTGEAVLAHAGTTCWNEYRRRWVLITVQWGGSSFLGEVWYSEADTPLGPWAYAVKVVTHNKYSFYNPKQHSFFDEDGGRRIYFEGTYASTFSGNPDPTPRYDYNQIMYRLDVDDVRLALPVAIRTTLSQDRQEPDWGPVPREGRGIDSQKSSGTLEELLGRIEFFAPDREAPGLVPVYHARRSDGPGAGRLTCDRKLADGPPRFYVVAADAPDPPMATVPLFMFRGAQGRVRYSTQATADPVDANEERLDQPLGRVWPNPWKTPPTAE